MKAARIHRFGDPGVIQVDDVDRPEPGAGQVLIQVAATSFNPTETALRSGALHEVLHVDLPLPLTLGWDVAGTIVELGEGVHAHAVGDQVIGLIDAAAAEFAVADAAAVVAAPATVRLADAAALPLAGLTAWQVVESAELVPGERVLVNGAGGGIGGFVVQLAGRAGTRVIATASPRSRSAVLRQGAGQVVDYTAARLGDAVAGQVDVVLNLVHVDQDRAAELAAVARRIVSATSAIEAPPGVRTAHVVARDDPAHLAALVALVDRGVLTIDVSEHHTLDDLATLHRRSEAGDLRGKVVVRPA